MALSGSAKELQPLLVEIRKNGFKVVPSGKHHKIVDVEGKLGAKGKIVADDHGPIIISSTPGDFRARDMHVKRLKDRGVIKADPWKPDKGEGKENRKRGEFDEESRQKARDTQAAESRRRAERTNQLRARVEPIVAQIGGWDKRGFQADLGRAAFHFLESNHRVERWKSLSGAMQNVRMLKAGSTLSDQSVDAWTLFIDELDVAWRKGPGTTPNNAALHSRFNELVRASKGLPAENGALPPPGRQMPAPIGPQETEVKERPQPPRSKVQLPKVVIARTPKLALEAMYLMATAGNGDDAHRTKVMEVAEEILCLELAALERAADDTEEGGTDE